MLYVQIHTLILLSFLIFGFTHCKDAKKRNPNRFCRICGISPGDQSISKKIINGKVMHQQNKYPWLVSIMNNGQIMCGGAIISSRFIITAAHCFLIAGAVREKSCLGKKVSNSACFYPPKVFQVGVLSPSGYREAIQVAKIIPHPMFSVDDRVHDIGLMKLIKPIECSWMSSPICLPQEDLNKYGKNLIVAGWGRNSEVSKEKEMREGKMTQVQNEECLQEGQSLSKARHYLCAVATQTHQKSCFGDSGSAIFSKFGDKYFALGVTSYGISTPYELCSLHKPAVFTKIYHHMKWIRKYVKDISKDILDIL